MRKLLLGGAAALAFAGLASAQTFTLTGDETVTISGEATVGQAWRHRDENGTIRVGTGSPANADLDMTIEGDGWTFIGEGFDANFNGGVSIETDSGWFATSDLSDYIDTVPEDYIVQEGFTGNYDAVPWAVSGGGNYSRAGARIGQHYRAFNTGIGYQSGGLTLAMRAQYDDGDESAGLAASLETGPATLAVQVDNFTTAAMLSFEANGFLGEFAYYSYSRDANNTIDEAELTRVTASYAVGSQTFSMSYRPEYDYTWDASQGGAGSHTGSDALVLAYEGEFDTFGIELGLTDMGNSLNRSGVFQDGGTTIGAVLTFVLAENVELGIGYGRGEDTRNGTSVDAEPNWFYEIYDIGLKVEF